MKILVCISKVPDTTTKIAFTENNTKFDENDVQFIINPYDEWYALVRGLELKEANGGSVTTITVGEADHDPVIRKALAIGADNAVRVDARATDAYFVAQQIAGHAKAEDYDLILCGKETIDYNGYQMGGMLAEMMDMAYISTANRLEGQAGSFTIERDAPGGNEVVEVSGPCVVSCAKGMAEQRIPNMRGIMSARTKPLKVVTAVRVDPLTEVSTFSLPDEKASCKYVDADNTDELVALLHHEAKAI